METLEQKKRRLFGRRYLPEYMTALSTLLKREVKSVELLSIVETDEFMNSIVHFKDSSPYYKKILKFSDKVTMKNILHDMISEWDTPYMMYLSNSMDCGLMAISSLYCFNWDFKFNDEKHGIIIFTRTDGEERILLDFYEEDLEQYIEIDIYKKLLLSDKTYSR